MKDTKYLSYNKYITYPTRNTIIIDALYPHTKYSHYYLKIKIIYLYIRSRVVLIRVMEVKAIYFHKYIKLFRDYGKIIIFMDMEK